MSSCNAYSIWTYNAYNVLSIHISVSLLMTTIIKLWLWIRVWALARVCVCVWCYASSINNFENKQPQNTLVHRLLVHTYPKRNLYIMFLWKFQCQFINRISCISSDIQWLLCGLALHDSGGDNDDRTRNVKKNLYTGIGTNSA